MYSPTTRLLTVLEMLQSHKQMSGPEIARRLEIDVRTVRRYIVMLQDMGIPVQAERGPHGAYRLERGHRMPPLLFSDSETVAFTLGLLAVREYGFPIEVAAVEGALAKVVRVLPENLLQQVQSLQEAIKFHVYSPAVSLNAALLVSLSVATQQKRQVCLHYRNWNGAESQRTFDPYGIVLNEGYWYTIGYCHLRQDVRTFRLDRILSLEPGKQSFIPPENFDPVAQVVNSIGLTPGIQAVEVLLETTLERAQQVISPIMGTLEQTDEGVLFRRPASQLEWIAIELICMDFPIRVIQPIELKDKLLMMAARAQKMVAE